MSYPAPDVRRTHLIDNYPAWPDLGNCLCGHPMSHHTPAAVAHRRCERKNCGCPLFTSELGIQPRSRLSTVLDRGPRNWQEDLRQTEDRVVEHMARQIMAAIGRLYTKGK